MNINTPAQRSNDTLNVLSPEFAEFTHSSILSLVRQALRNQLRLYCSDEPDNLSDEDILNIDQAQLLFAMIKGRFLNSPPFKTFYNEGHDCYRGCGVVDTTIYPSLITKEHHKWADLVENINSRESFSIQKDDIRKILKGIFDTVIEAYQRPDDPQSLKGYVTSRDIFDALQLTKMNSNSKSAILRYLKENNLIQQRGQRPNCKYTNNAINEVKLFLQENYISTKDAASKLNAEYSLKLTSRDILQAAKNNPGISIPGQNAYFINKSRIKTYFKLTVDA